MPRAARLVLIAAVAALAIATLRGVLLRRNEARYGGPHTPYGPDGARRPPDAGLPDSGRAAP